MTKNDNKVLYRELVSHWESPESVVIGCNSRQRHVTDSSDETDFESFLAWMMYADSVSYLPDDILVKVDRAAMSTSLETRAPFLDPNVINAAVNLPMSFKLRDGQTKWCLKEILADYLPRDLINRPKMGFGVPLGQWLRGPLKSWAHDLLQPEKLRREGYFDEKRVNQVLCEHVNGQRDWHYHLWDVLMFQSWKENAGL
jgi:asparagine synthase (glutamine-hydrolysing)